MDEKTIKAIDDILKRGNDAKIRRKGDGYIIVEIKETIKYRPPSIVAREGQ
jgi:transcriptional antiterminator